MKLNGPSPIWLTHVDGKLSAGTWAGAVGLRASIILYVGIATELVGFNKARWIGSRHECSKRQEMKAVSLLKPECRKGAHHHFSIFYWSNYHRALPELRTTDMDLMSRNCYLITTIYLYKIIHLVLLPFKYPVCSYIFIVILTSICFSATPLLFPCLSS